MELRKDPITRSWVVVGHPEREKERAEPCPLCPENRTNARVLVELPERGNWQVRAYPHFRPQSGDVYKRQRSLRANIELASLAEMRPVVMACAAACLGLLPAAVSTGIGVQAQQPLARVVVGGMITSPLAILFLIPVLASYWLPPKDETTSGTSK